MAFNPVERATNLITVLLETPVPLTLDQIVHAMPGQFPEGAESMGLLRQRGGFDQCDRR